MFEVKRKTKNNVTVTSKTPREYSHSLIGLAKPIVGPSWGRWGRQGRQAGQVGPVGRVDPLGYIMPLPTHSR